MAVRNFWITTTLDHDPTTTRHATGPRAKDEGFAMTIQQRKDGAIVTALEVYGFAREDGTLVLEVRNSDGDTIDTFTTKR